MCSTPTLALLYFAQGGRGRRNPAHPHYRGAGTADGAGGAELIRHLAALTDDVVTAAKTYDPAKITHYVIDLATLFHKFYNAQRVMVEDEGLMQARLYLCTAVKNTIRNVLTMLKISVPERM